MSCTEGTMRQMGLCASTLMQCSAVLSREVYGLYESTLMSCAEGTMRQVGQRSDGQGSAAATRPAQQRRGQGQGHERVRCVCVPDIELAISPAHG